MAEAAHQHAEPDRRVTARTPAEAPTAESAHAEAPTPAPLVDAGAPGDAVARHAATLADPRLAQIGPVQ
ncbi:MAG TPA: hypothetical protein VNL77_10910, partial [Roseiflexaceae bacterium]|nr:hypothetical protein [Roseiflexaceae bacterium]